MTQEIIPTVTQTSIASNPISLEEKGVAKKGNALTKTNGNSSSIGVAKAQKTYSLKSMIDLVKYPVLTEKTSIVLTKNRQYTFDVDKRLTKTQIKKLFEALFQVNVIGVNTHIPPRKTVRVGLARGTRPLYKRAIITLKENQTINYSLNINKI